MKKSGGFFKEIKMSLCDMCGKETDLVVALIEGTELNVCRECGKFGKILRKLKTEELPKKFKRIRHHEGYGGHDWGNDATYRNGGGFDEPGCYPYGYNRRHIGGLAC